MLISNGRRINLVEIENLREWICYMPECFISKLECDTYRNRLVKDRVIHNNIEKLYSFIEDVTQEKVNCKDSSFSIGIISMEKYNQYDELLNAIPKLNVEEYAKFKLTNDEQQFCHNFANRYPKEKFFKLNDEIDSINNFFIRSYTRYLLNNLSKDEIKDITQNCWKQFAKSINELNRRQKKLERKTYSEAQNFILY